MKKRPKNFDFLSMVAESSPEMAELVKEIRADYASGRIRDEPWRWDQCRSWLDGWLYIYRRTYLGYQDHLLWENERVKLAVQIGPDFDDKTVALLERLAGRLGPCADLQELRLIGTRVTDEGLARLQRVLPNAKITRYSREDEDANPELGYAKGYPAATKPAIAPACRADRLLRRFVDQER